MALHTHHRTFSGRGTVAALGLCIAAVAPVRAEEEAIAIEPPRIVVSADEFDERLFGGVANAETIAARCAAELAYEIGALDRVCALSDLQKRKLQLAGRGDIKAFFDRAYELRRRYVGIELTEEKHNEIVTAIRDFKAANRWNQFGEKSLFRKMMQKVLSDEQVRLVVEWVVSEWDLRLRGVQLEPAAHKRLAELLRSKSQPPLGWGCYTYHVVTLQLAELAAEVQPLIAQAERPVFQQQLAEARKLEPKLREVGAWPVRGMADDDGLTN